MNKEELENVMAGCYGTECYYKNPMFNVNYTDGVKCFCQNAGGGAYWLLTDICLFIREARKKNPNEDMFSVHLVVNNGKADLLFKDGDDEVCYKRHYSLTDCPDGDWCFYYFVSDRVLIWNGEYQVVNKNQKNR